MAIRLVLAEDNVLLREGLTRLFGQTEGVELQEAVGTLDDLLAYWRRAIEHEPAASA